MKVATILLATTLATSSFAQHTIDFPDVPETHAHFEFFQRCRSVGFEIECTAYPVRSGPMIVSRSEFAQATVKVIDTFEETMAKYRPDSYSLAFFTNTWKNGLLGWIKEFSPELTKMGRSPKKLRAKVHSFTPKVKALVARFKKLAKKYV